MKFTTVLNGGVCHGIYICHCTSTQHKRRNKMKNKEKNHWPGGRRRSWWRWTCERGCGCIPPSLAPTSCYWRGSGSIGSRHRSHSQSYCCVGAASWRPRCVRAHPSSLVVGVRRRHIWSKAKYIMKSRKHEQDVSRLWLWTVVLRLHNRATTTHTVMLRLRSHATTTTYSRAITTYSHFASITYSHATIT